MSRLPGSLGRNVVQDVIGQTRPGNYIGAIEPGIAAETALRQTEAQLGQQQQQFNTAQANRQQLLQLIGLTPQTVGQGGLLGNTFFQSVLGNTLPDVVGGVTGALPNLPGVGGQPGGTTGAGGSLFEQQIAGRGQLGQQILGLLGGYGESERARIAQEQKDLQNTALARLEARGLGSSNLTENALRGAAKFGSEQRAALGDRLIGQQIGALQGIGEGIFGDVGQELNRQQSTRGQLLGLLGGVLGSALNI